MKIINKPIDRRIKYKLVLDVETMPINPLVKGVDPRNMAVYDIGYVITDKKGRIWDFDSFLVEEIFIDYFEDMKSAYYAKKIPRYIMDIQNRKRNIVPWWFICEKLARVINEFGITEVYAYNARFDCYALRATRQYIGQAAYALPYNIEWCDIWAMAKDTICRQKTYERFCRKNGYLTKNGRLKTSAEVVYQYINADTDFQESHTGLEDCIIESQIMAKCFRQHKPMRKLLF